MSEAQDPTVLFPAGAAGGSRGGAPLESGPSIVDQKIVEAAIRRGLISAVQASSVLSPSTATTPAASGVASALDSLVARGLVTPQAARELEDEVKNDFVPGYRLLGEVGRGGMGVVYKALQKRLDRTVALKVVNPGASGDPDYLRRFDQEARALAKLNHPNIVQVYDCGETAGKVYLALEFIEGPDALRELRQSGPMSEVQALRIIRDSAEGLGHALAAGIIHRDVKPANLMLVARAKGPDDGWMAKVTDLGLARRAERSGQSEAESTKAGTILGSPAYMAPEQADGEVADFRSDIYALGATLYHLVTGKPPYDAESAIKVIVKKQTERLEDPRTVAPKLSDGFVHVLDRCMARPRAERYASYAALIEDVDRVLRGERPATPPVSEAVSSLRLGKATGRFAPEGVRPETPAGGGGGGRAAAIVVMGAVVLSGVVAIAMVWNRAQTLAGGSASEAPPAFASPAGRATAMLDALATLSPRDALEMKRLADAKAVVAAVPEAERGPLSLRLASVVGKALDATAGERVASLEAALARADYPALVTGVTRAVEPYRLLERDLPPRLRELWDIGEQAGGQAGEAERAAWAAAQAASEPLGVIAALEAFEQRYPWSPVLEQAKAKLAAAVAQAPELTVRVIPASAKVTLDGKPLSPGEWRGRVALGTHALAAEAEGYFVVERSLEVTPESNARLILLRLFPKPERPLVEDVDLGSKVFSPTKPAHVEWPDQSGTWLIVAGALRGEAPGEGAWGVARRDVTPGLAKIKRPPTGPWQLVWECAPPDEGRAELRLAGDGAGRSVAVGVRKGEVYLAVRQADGGEQAIATAPLAAGPAPYFTADWDGRVLLVRCRKELLGSLVVAWAPAAPPSIQAAVQGKGAAEFRSMELRALQESGAR